MDIYRNVGAAHMIKVFVKKQRPMVKERYNPNTEY